jgi:branched-chain amino acid transport system ATP-binding protein
MLQIKSLNKSFDGFKAVNNASLDVQKGEIVAVIGPNGAGKTTLFNLITGVLRPDSGEVLFKNENITGLPPHEICKKRISRSFQVVNVFNRLSIFENTQISILSREKKTWNLFTPSSKLAVDETNELLRNVGLYEKRDRISGALSHGDRKVLEIAMALGGNPEFLILDEPTRGIDINSKKEIYEFIHRLAQEQISCIIVSSEMEEIIGMCDRVYVMREGRVAGCLEKGQVTEENIVFQATGIKRV